MRTRCSWKTGEYASGLLGTHSGSNRDCEIVEKQRAKSGMVYTRHSKPDWVPLASVVNCQEFILEFHNNNPEAAPTEADGQDAKNERPNWVSELPKGEQEEWEDTELASTRQQVI